MSRMYGLTIGLGALLVAAFVFFPGDVRAQDASLLFKVYCARCHGFEGHGDGADAGTLKTRPRDFTDCKLMKTISDDTMFKAIKDGGTAVNLPNDMPSWSAGLSDDQIHTLMTYIRGLCQK
jgi:cytochrome c oxidase cbb3-type subunit III